MISDPRGTRSAAPFQHEGGADRHHEHRKQSQRGTAALLVGGGVGVGGLVGRGFGRSFSNGIRRGLGGSLGGSLGRFLGLWIGGGLGLGIGRGFGVLALIQGQTEVLCHGLGDLVMTLGVGVDIVEADVGQLLGAMVDDGGDIHSLVAKCGSHLLNGLIDGGQEASAELSEGLKALHVVHGVVLLQKDHPRVGGFLLEEGCNGLQVGADVLQNRLHAGYEGGVVLQGVVLLGGGGGEDRGGLGEVGHLLSREHIGDLGEDAQEVVTADGEDDHLGVLDLVFQGGQEAGEVPCLVSVDGAVDIGLTALQAIGGGDAVDIGVAEVGVTAVGVVFESVARGERVTEGQEGLGSGGGLLGHGGERGGGGEEGEGDEEGEGFQEGSFHGGAFLLLWEYSE